MQRTVGSRAVPDVLIFANTETSAEMRHEVPVLVPDPFLYVEKDGKKLTASTAFEVERIKAAGIEAHAWEEFGYDEMLAEGVPREEVTWLRINLNACRAFGVTEAVVPRTFPVIVADYLRANGITVTPDHHFFADRRRVKNDAEIAGIRKAQKAAEAGMAAAKEILARAETANGGLTVDGEPLTSELIKGAIRRAFTEHGVASDDFIVSHGAQTAIGHELGFGAIAPDEPIVIDLWPKDPESSCYADMTRTFVVGTAPDELVEYYRLVKEALDRSLEATKPGVLGLDVFKLVCELFEENGQPTVLSKKPGEVLEDGFFHGLGHGVGLEVHEAPNLGRGGTAELVPGDVVTLEPGLYRQGFGGCRLEDLVLVTEDGAENLTDFPYDLTP
jgi:Xaa-Pro aminopeptidase